MQWRLNWLLLLHMCNPAPILFQSIQLIIVTAGVPVTSYKELMQLICDHPPCSSTYTCFPLWSAILTRMSNISDRPRWYSCRRQLGWQWWQSSPLLCVPPSSSIRISLSSNWCIRPSSSIRYKHKTVMADNCLRKWWELLNALCCTLKGVFVVYEVLYIEGGHGTCYHRQNELRFTSCDIPWDLHCCLCWHFLHQSLIHPSCINWRPSPFCPYLL